MLIWVPAALVLALGWPALLLSESPGLMQAALIAGGGACVFGIVWMGAGYLFGVPPRTRRTAATIVLFAGLIAALAAPFVFSAMLDALARSERSQIGSGLGADAAWAMAPLALMIGVPTALFAGLVVSLVALVKPPRQSWAETIAPPAAPVRVMVTEAASDAHGRGRTPELASDSDANA